MNLKGGGVTAVSAEQNEKDPKTDNSVRTLHIPKAVSEELRKRKSRIDTDKMIYGKNYIDNGYVCCQRNGRPRGSSSLNKAISTICGKRGLPHITVHSLRHMYASILLEQNYELQIVSACLGHTSINTTFEIYADIMDANKEIKAYMDDIYTVEDD